MIGKYEWVNMIGQYDRLCTWIIISYRSLLLVVAKVTIEITIWANVVGYT